MILFDQIAQEKEKINGTCKDSCLCRQEEKPGCYCAWGVCPEHGRDYDSNFSFGSSSSSGRCSGEECLTRDDVPDEIKKGLQDLLKEREDEMKKILESFKNAGA